MKRVISGEELYKIEKEAIDILCNTVGSTLGPSGNNVIINSDEEMPYVTNDGVTIAKSIGSDEKGVDTIIEIAKEASLKTDEIVGDGTTTTLVLLQSIFNLGLEKIKNGYDPIGLKEELNKSLSEVLSLIEKEKIIPDEGILENISYTSCNDLEISKLLVEVFMKMKRKHAIRIKESNNEKSYYEIKKGYSISSDNIASAYFKDSDEIVLDNCYILILKGYLDNLEQISNIINEGLSLNKNIIIFVDEVNETIKEEVLMYYLEYQKNIFIFNIADYSSRKEMIEEDIANISESNIINLNYKEVSFKELGLVEQAIIKKDEIVLLTKRNIDKYLEKLENIFNNTNSDYEREFIATRISKLKLGIATIYIGDITKTAAKEKIMRTIDALNALDIASLGCVVGEGITLLKISALIDDKILKESLLIPFRRILENKGIDYKKIEEKIKESNYKKIYNLKTNIFDEIITIYDPIKVVETSLKNAISIASMLLTTKYLVINEKISSNDVNIL